MTEAKELISAFIHALESERPESAAQYLTEDFSWQGTLPNPLSKAIFLRLMATMKSAFPDYALNVTMTQKLAENHHRLIIDSFATHTGVLKLPGLTPIQPTGRAIAMPRHACEVILREGKIAQFRIEEPTDGGLLGLLKHIGVEEAEAAIEKVFR